MGINMSEEEYADYIKRRSTPKSSNLSCNKRVKGSDDRNITKGKKKRLGGKYGNRKVIVGDMKFDSEKEYNRYRQLKILEQAGIVTKIERQVPFELMEGYYLDGKKVQNIEYVCDFRVTYADGHVEIEDVKSEATKKDKVYVLKRKLFHYKYRDLRIKEV